MFVNADKKSRKLRLQQDFTSCEVVVDQTRAGVSQLDHPTGVKLTADTIILEPLTAVILKEKKS